MRILCFGLLIAAVSGCGMSRLNQTEGEEGGTLHALNEIGGYTLTTLEIMADEDTDGDGVVDNHLPAALNAVDVLLPDEDFDLASFNAKVAEGITISQIHLDARRMGPAIDIDIAVALSEEPTDLDATHGKATPSARLSGVFTEGNTFLVGPADLEVDVIGAPDEAPVPIQLWDAVLDGSIDELGVRGTLYAIIPIEDLMEDVVEPLLPEEGADLDGDGILETHDELLDFVWDLAPTIGDITLEDGTTAISVALILQAVPR